MSTRAIAPVVGASRPTVARDIHVSHRETPTEAIDYATGEVTNLLACHGYRNITGHGSVTAMETELEVIGECGHDLTDCGRHAVRVEGLLQPSRGWYRKGSFLICSDCWRESLTEFGGIARTAAVNDNLNRFNYGNSNCVSGLYGGEKSTGAHPCEGCGLPVERGANPRTRIHTCSRACTVRVSKRNSVSATVTDENQVRPCPICGTQLTGRADRRYCSDRCRQHALRARRVTPEKRAEAEAKLSEAFANLQTLMHNS